MHPGATFGGEELSDIEDLQEGCGMDVLIDTCIECFEKDADDKELKNKEGSDAV